MDLVFDRLPTSLAFSGVTCCYCMALSSILSFIPSHLTSTFSSSEIYRQKLQQCVTDGELSDDNVAALLRLRVMLCIPQQTVEAVHAEICGTIFEKVIQFITPLSLSSSFFLSWSWAFALQFQRCLIEKKTHVNNTYLSLSSVFNPFPLT